MADRSSRSADRRAAELARLDNRYVWHPFTPMQPWIAAGDEPGRVIESAEGFELIDTRGRRYIDGFSSLWCNLHGHRVPAIDQAIRLQLDKVAHSTLLGHASAPSIELARRLVKIAPEGLEKVFYSDSGATAVEIALKMAFQYYRNLRLEGRRRFLALRRGYHGDTIGAVSLGGIDTFHDIFRPLLFETTFVDSPNAYHHPAGTAAGQAVLDQMDRILRDGAGLFCAVVVEPLVQAAAGMLTHPPGFLAGVREITRRRHVLMIADEVATGFCRTGRLFACEHENVSPDLMCLGKGLSGGYLPVAATLATQEVFDAFCGEPAAGRTFYHGHTFTGNALGCAAACASIDLIFETKLLEAMPAKIERMRKHLAALAEHPHVGDIRQCGMMAGIELVARRPREAFEPARRVGAAVCLHARDHGLIIRPLGDIVALMPAPGMDLVTLERMMQAAVTSLEEFFAGGQGP